ncbi:bifunctional phosphoribosyl-AMP cyclohydrolase/phosphoribosyl-ATP diphosphatase HisIE [Patescibacteria group bacterium]
MKLNFNKMEGLIPVIIQSEETLKVLMLGFMNQDALKKTQKSGLVTFWSRTKKRLWTKGEKSGNTLKVVSIEPDCDQDTLLIKAIPNGPTCHTGNKMCFQNQNFDIYDLFKLISERKELLPKNSYTTRLFEEGLDKILEKIQEESNEIIYAAKKENRKRVIEESCDLIYHLMVLLVQEGISLDDLNQEFVKRRKKSNLC